MDWATCWEISRKLIGMVTLIPIADVHDSATLVRIPPGVGFHVFNIAILILRNLKCFVIVFWRKIYGYKKS
jgi:hypothetical protein